MIQSQDQLQQGQPSVKRQKMVKCTVCVKLGYNAKFASEVLLNKHLLTEGHLDAVRFSLKHFYGEDYLSLRCLCQLRISCCITAWMNLLSYVGPNFQNCGYCFLVLLQASCLHLTLLVAAQCCSAGITWVKSEVLARIKFVHVAR